jgi:hypothetical protein
LYNGGLSYNYLVNTVLPQSGSARTAAFVAYYTDGLAGDALTSASAQALVIADMLDKILSDSNGAAAYMSNAIAQAGASPANALKNAFLNAAKIAFVKQSPYYGVSSVPLDYSAFAYGDRNRQLLFNSISRLKGVQSFSGTAIGGIVQDTGAAPVLDFENDAHENITLTKAKDLYGAATLKIDPAKRTNDSLEVNFGGLKLKFGAGSDYMSGGFMRGVRIDQSAAMSNGKLFGEFEPLLDSYDAAKGGTGSFSFNVYGPSAHKPREAVGTFRYDDYRTVLTGSFGAKNLNPQLW